MDSDFSETAYQKSQHSHQVKVTVTPTDGLVGYIYFNIYFDNCRLATVSHLYEARASTSSGISLYGQPRGFSTSVHQYNAAFSLFFAPPAGNCCDFCIQ